MTPALRSLQARWREECRYRRLRRAMRRGGLLEVVKDFDVDEVGRSCGERVEVWGSEPPLGRAVRVKKVGK